MVRPRLRKVKSVWWWILVVLAVTTAHAGKKPDQEKMPVHAGILPNQQEIQVRFEKGSKYVPDKEARAALTSAIRAWNAVLPADLKLVEKVASEPLPKGEVVILVRFDSDPKTFPGTGVDQAGDIRGIIDRKNNQALVALFLVDTPAFVKAGGFSTTGAPAARDLELVILHELGHALGIEHVDNAKGIPPVMAPVLEPNAQLLAAGKKLVDVRAITQDDKEWLKIKGGDTPEEINVVATIQPLKVKYGVKGTLKRK